MGARRESSRGTGGTGGDGAVPTCGGAGDGRCSGWRRRIHRRGGGEEERGERERSERGGGPALTQNEWASPIDGPVGPRAIWSLHKSSLNQIQTQK